MVSYLPLIQNILHIISTSGVYLIREIQCYYLGKNLD